MISKILELHSGNIATCSKDKTINIWDRQSGVILYTLEGFDDTIKQIVELDADNLIVLTEEDSSFLAWSYKKDQQENCKYFEEHNDLINKIIVVSNKYIFTASTDTTIKRWTLKSGDQATY